MSGMVYLIDKFTEGTLSDPIAVRSMLQSTAMQVHGALAMVMVFVGGSLVSHVVRAWPTGIKRRSGIGVISAFGVLVCSGWALYYLGSDAGREVAAVGHWIVGMIFPALIGVHVRLRWVR